MNAPYFLPRFFNDINRKTIDATIMHEMGSKLEVKSNCPEFETFIITTTGNKRSVVLNGKELTVVDFQRGARRISQTTELPSGEHLTTTVEWTEDSLKKNQALITSKSGWLDQVGDYWVIYLLSKNLNPIAMKELLEELKPVMAPASNSYQPAYPSMEMDEKESNM